MQIGKFTNNNLRARQKRFAWDWNVKTKFAANHNRKKSINKIIRAS